MNGSARRSDLWQSVRFPNSRGQQLAGLYYQAPASEMLLVVCHGFTGSKEGSGKAMEMAGYFGRTGASTLLFDFAGNGESQGRFEDTTLSGQMDDLSCALDWCGQKAPSAPIIALGRSFGGTTAICQAAQDPRVCAVSSWAAPADPLTLFSSFCREDSGEPQFSLLSGDEGTVRIKNSFFDDLRRHDVLQAAAGITPRPLLIVHGAMDELVPLQEAERIFAAAGQPKELMAVPGADHRFSEASAQVWEACRAWLERIQPEQPSERRQAPLPPLAGDSASRQAPAADRAPGRPSHQE